MAMPLVSRRPVDAGRQVRPRGRVVVLAERCKDCSFCIDFCPNGVLTRSPEMNERGYHFPMVAPGKEDDCVHCQFCTLVCPEYAIYTLEVRP